MFQTITNELIMLRTLDESILVLTKMTAKELQDYNSKFELGIKNIDNCFFFNSLKVHKNTKGESTKILTELVKLLDKHGTSVILEVTSDGVFSLNALINFYQTFGFILVVQGDGEALMRR